MQFRRFPMPSITLPHRLLSRKGIERVPLLVNRSLAQIPKHAQHLLRQPARVRLSLGALSLPNGLALGRRGGNDSGYSGRYSCLGDIHAKGYQVHWFPINHKRYLYRHIDLTCIAI